MFFQRKEKFYLSQFLHRYLQTLFKANVKIPEEALEKLTAEEKETFTQELFYFRCFLIIYRLSEIKTFGQMSFEMEDIKKTFFSALEFARLEAGIEDSNILSNFIERQKHYLNRLNQFQMKDSEQFKDRGAYFYILLIFQERILQGEHTKFDPKNMSKGFLFFDFGKQVYKYDMDILSRTLKKVEFIDK